MIAAGEGNWDIPDCPGPGRPRNLFRLATLATVTEVENGPDERNNVAVASVADVATAADPEDDLL